MKKKTKKIIEAEIWSLGFEPSDFPKNFRNPNGCNFSKWALAISSFLMATSHQLVYTVPSANMDADLTYISCAIIVAIVYLFFQ